MTTYRRVALIIVGVLVLGSAGSLAYVYSFWPFNSSSTESTNVQPNKATQPGLPPKQEPPSFYDPSDLSWIEDPEQRFKIALEIGGDLYNCPENDPARQAKDVNMLVPCGTDMVLVTWKNNTADAAPEIQWIKGQGGDNVIVTEFFSVTDLYENRDPRGPRWDVKWTVGEGSELLQIYEQYRGDDGNLHWAPTSALISLKGQDGYNHLDLRGYPNTKIALVFTDGSVGSKVPGEWWNEGTGDPCNLRY